MRMWTAQTQDKVSKNALPVALARLLEYQERFVKKSPKARVRTHTSVLPCVLRRSKLPTRSSTYGFAITQGGMSQAWVYTCRCISCWPKQLSSIFVKQIRCPGVTWAIEFQSFNSHTAEIHRITWTLEIPLNSLVGSEVKGVLSFISVSCDKPRITWVNLRLFSEW